MERLVLQSRVGADGVLQLAVPMDTADANREVRVTIEPATPAGPKPLTPEEWRKFIFATAGSIPDPSFRRHEQGEYEQREELS